MIVCLCVGLNEASVKKEISNGCKSFEELVQRCGVGQDCGICCDSAKVRFEEMNRAQK